MKLSKVLIIEDDGAVRENLKELLMAADYNAITAINGLDGLEKIHLMKPDLILCDINMPEMDGFEMIEILRKTPETFSIPFLFLTALNDNKLQRKGMTLGADDYITKPYDSADLLSAIATKLQKHEAIKQSFNATTSNLEKKQSDIIPFEILTPLNNIKGFSHVLINGCDEMDKVERNYILNIINHSSDRLIKLIENYSILMKLDNTLDLVASKDNEPSNIKKLIIQKQSYLQEYYDSKDIASIMNVDDCFFYFSQLHLEKIVFETLENAFRHSLDNRTIYIEGKTTDDSYLFKIEYYAKGLSLRFIENIESFSFSNVAEFEQQSYGLGLALVKKLTDIYNGTFEIISIPYEKTTIKIMIPLFVQ